MADSTARSRMGLEGKTVVVLGVADESSIAWGIARAFAEQGARVHIGYQQKYFSRVRLLLREFPMIQGSRCDVLNDEEIAAFFRGLDEAEVQVLVHAIAYAAPELFTEYPSQVSAEGFSQSLGISAFSLCKVLRSAKPLLAEWASVITLSFQAAQRAEPSYGLMGVAKSALESLVRYLALELGTRNVRVNAISPGPVQTVAALGIPLAYIHHPEALRRQRNNTFAEAISNARAEGGYSDDFTLAQAVWTHFEASFAERCAIEEPVTKEDVANCALFLGSPYAHKITGQVIHVDGGYSSSMVL